MTDSYVASRLDDPQDTGAGGGAHDAGTRDGDQDIAMDVAQDVDSNSAQDTAQDTAQDMAQDIAQDIAHDGGSAGAYSDARTLRAGVEAVLLVADEPIDAPTFARALGCGTPAVVDTLADLRIEYDADGRGFELREVAGGWRLYTRASHAEVVERFVLDGQHAKLSQAALETLAVVAYRQPVSRSRIAAIRGVNVDGVIRTLVTRGLVAEAGTDPEGTAVLYATTPYFLERLGIAGVDELPEVSGFLPELGALDEADF